MVLVLIMASTESAGGAGAEVQWREISELGVEGQGWSETSEPYDRFPGRAEGVVPDPVWQLSRHSAGLCVRFVTDATLLAARWRLRFGSLAMPHMAATGVSGLDLYVRATSANRHGARWRWLAVGRPEKFPVNEHTLVSGLRAERREYMLYLPLYNGVESVEIGVPSSATLTKAPARPAERAKPICFYGTSITQGGCASRPGMAYPAILGRALDRPTINLGFSGNGRMDPEVVELLAELDPCVYVIDCLPNMTPPLVTERTAPLVETLRRAHPSTPIVLVENITYQDAWLHTGRHQSYTAKNCALREAYERLVGGGVANLHYVAGERLLGDDGEATVDGTHPTDVGFLRIADVLQRMLGSLPEVGAAQQY